MIVCLTNEELEQFSSYIDRILSSLEEMVGNQLDQEAYEWMERIQLHMGREQFEKVVEEQLQKIFQGQNVFLQIMMDQFQGEDQQNIRRHYRNIEISPMEKKKYFRGLSNVKRNFFSVGLSAMILDGLLIISSLMFNYYAMKYGDYVLAGFGISQKDSHISDRIDHRIGCRTVYISKIRCDLFFT